MASSSSSSLKNSANVQSYFDFQFSSQAAEPKAIPEAVHHQLHYQQPRHHQPPAIPYGMVHNNGGPSVAIPPGAYVGKDSGGAYNFNDLDQALMLYSMADGSASELPPGSILSEQMKESSGMRPPTLNIFPSQPMHVSPSPSSAKASAGMLSSSPSSSGSKRSSEPSMELAKPASRLVEVGQPSKTVKVEGNGRRVASSSGITSEQEGPKTPDPKTLRRLAQNREAARKSRLRKKAYVQQLENSRIRLTQLEQELHRARAQGLFVGGSAMPGGDQQSSSHGNMNSAVAVFDVEYARWLDEHSHIMMQMRSALNSHVPEQQLRDLVQSCLQHIDLLIALKTEIARTDVFHLLSGNWKTPAERCFLWMGGFRPSQVIKIIMSQIEPLTEQQLMAICSLQQQTQEAEEGLSQGLEALNHSLSDIITSEVLGFSENMGGGFMNHMALAMNRLSSIEGFVRQADILRQQMLDRLQHVLTVRQAARCLLAISEYFHRLRALSSLWMSRPRE